MARALRAAGLPDLPGKARGDDEVTDFGAPSGDDAADAEEDDDESGTPSKDSGRPPRTMSRNDCLGCDTFPEDETQEMGTGSSAVGFFKHQKVIWERRHKDGWRPYRHAEASRIEAAFLRGDSYVRLRAKTQSDSSIDMPVELFFSDMIQYNPTSEQIRQVRRLGPLGWRRRSVLLYYALVRLVETGTLKREGFANYQRRREDVADRIANVLEGKEEKLDHFWRRHGSMPQSLACAHFNGSSRSKSFIGGSPAFLRRNWFAQLAQSSVFFQLSVLFIALNSAWIWVDTDLNYADSLVTAEPYVVIVENVFCLYFTTELIIRYAAHLDPWHCLTERWFMFDTILVCLMILETWVVPLAILLGGGSGRKTQLNVLRVFRILRISRIARLLRAFPDLMVLVKGIRLSMRTVSFTVVLLLGLTFVFAVIFRSHSMGDEGPMEDMYFPSVLDSMLNLLIYGTLLDSPMVFHQDVREHMGPLYVILYWVFIFLSSFTVLNMLIGILVAVVDRVSRKEKLEAEKAFLGQNLGQELLEVYDKSGQETLAREDFDLLMSNPETHDVLEKFGTDPETLILLADQIYHQDSDGMLTFTEFLQTVIRLRDGKGASVKDVVELRTLVEHQVDRLWERLESMHVAASEQASDSSTVAPEPPKEENEEAARVWKTRLRKEHEDQEDDDARGGTDCTGERTPSLPKKSASTPPRFARQGFLHASPCTSSQAPPEQETAVQRLRRVRRERRCSTAGAGCPPEPLPHPGSSAHSRHSLPGPRPPSSSPPAIQRPPSRYSTGSIDLRSLLGRSAAAESVSPVGSLHDQQGSGASTEGSPAVSAKLDAIVAGQQALLEQVCGLTSRLERVEAEVRELRRLPQDR